MSTIYEASNAQNTVVQERKRPRAASTSAKTARKPFVDQHCKKLSILGQADDCNHKMGYVDQADQLTANDPGLRRVRRGGWHALWLFMFNISLTNSYLLSSVKSQYEFGTQFYKHLCHVGSSTRKRKWTDSQPKEELYTASLNGESRKLQRYHMNKYHHYRRNHSSLHSIAATPILDSGYNRYYSYCGPELLLERWIHGYVALPPIRSFTAKFYPEISCS
jgi:hypothetical protein